MGAAQAALCCLALAMLVGCATPAPMSGPGAPAPDSFAGEPVDDVRFARLIEWRPVDRDHLMLRFDRNRYVLVEPMDPCFANLREAEGMRLVQSVSNRLHISDRLLIDGRECRIVSIRPFYFVEWATAVSEAAQDDSGGM
ncbi:MAG: DUF6491 family protein [Wenzhouxiangellaceae bacterium]